MKCDSRLLAWMAAGSVLLTGLPALRAQDDLPSWNSRESAEPASLKEEPTAAAASTKKRPTVTPAPTVAQTKPEAKPAPKPEAKPAVAKTKPATALTSPAAPVSTKPSGLAKAQAQEKAVTSATNVATTEVSQEVGSSARPVRLSSKHALTRPRRSTPPGHHDRDNETFEPREVATTETPAPAIPPIPNNLAKLDNRPPKVKFERHVVKQGDTLWGLSRKYKTTVGELKTANGLNTDHLSIGQVLLIPHRTSSISAATPAPAVARASAAASPVADAVPTPVAEPAAAPVLAATPKPEVQAASWPPAPEIPERFTLDKPHSNSVLKYPNPNQPAPVMQVDGHIFLSDAQRNLIREAHRLAERDIDYNQRWRPAGEKERWVMDCSNTSRYLYQVACGIKLPRTASSQYYVLRQKKRCWNIPLDDEGRPSIAYMQRHLQVGDLLFWEHTYKPKRNPPITHVTIFMGTDKEGRWIMAGSQSAGHGLISDDRSGPDLYVFNPHMPCGGYSGFFSKTKGRFVAHGRPLPDATVNLAQLDQRNTR